MKKVYMVFSITLLALSACKRDIEIVNIPGGKKPVILSQNIIVNPSGFAPLVATIKLTTDIETQVRIRVAGKHGSVSDVINNFTNIHTSHEILVLGLYAAYANSVEITLADANGENAVTDTVIIRTEPLKTDLPAIDISASLPEKKRGMTLVSYFGNIQVNQKIPFIFDEFGDIRWYLDFSTSPVLYNFYFEDGVERLKNGNLYFGDSYTDAIYEVTMTGEILNTWKLPGYGFHHQVLEKPNGNFLISADKLGISTVEDFVIEVDRNSKQIINEWDFRQLLQVGRTAWTTNIVDWMHINAVEFDASDNSIIVSGRTQGVVKVDANNHVKWIIAPHAGWGLAGDGTDLNTKLLQPLDANGMFITDTSVVNGFTNHPDFEWNWYQHAAKVMPGGHVSLFDNGDKRNYSSAVLYSRAVEYKIDEANMTIQQVWQYGKERGAETYSRIVSDVDYYSDNNHFIFSPGSVITNGKYGKIIEIDRSTSAVLFEATLFPPTSFTGIVTLHRSERLSLYP